MDQYIHHQEVSDSHPTHVLLFEEHLSFTKKTKVVSHRNRSFYVVQCLRTRNVKAALLTHEYSPKKN